jgi:hypothetical protein
LIGKVALVGSKVSVLSKTWEERKMKWERGRVEAELSIREKVWAVWGWWKSEKVWQG